MTKTRRGMDKIRVKVASKETFSWPPFCVLCLKPKPEKCIESYFANMKLEPPYCQECYDKVNRHERLFVERPATITAVLGGYGGIVAGLVYLLNAVRQEGKIALLSKESWKMAIVLFWVVLGIIFLVLSFLGALLEPVLDRILLSVFPNKFAHPGVEVSKSSVREIMTYPTPGTAIKIQKPVIEELGFSNPEYVGKFRKANGLEGEKYGDI